MRRFTPRKACTCCSEPMSYVFQRSSAAIMHDSGGASAEVFGMLVLGMLMTSAVAMFFSWSGATDLSDLLAQLLTICGLRFLRPIPAFFFGRFNPANVMILLPLFS